MVTLQIGMKSRFGQGRLMRLWNLARRAFLLLPVAFVTMFLILPLAITVAVSFWRRSLLKLVPAFTLNNYTDFLTGTRLTVLERSFIVSIEATVLGLLIAYPIAYFLALKVRAKMTRMVLLLFTVPFLINYIIRAFAWTYLLGRTGPINSALIALGLTRVPIDWLLYSDFAVLVGMTSSYMPFMIFPLWMSISGIDRRLIEASWMLGASPARTFLKVSLPLSLPGIFAAIIFSFVGCFGESAIPTILGGVGYQLIGNEISSAMDTLNYPLAAAMSSVVTGGMLALLVAWYVMFDLRAFLGKVLVRR
jgi:ABC-type spermidine/putrescine transport system permease subunit I